MSKIIIFLVSKNGDNDDNSSPQLSHQHNSLIMSIVDTPEKDSSNVEGKSHTRKVHTSLVKPSSTLFSYSVRTMYNRVPCA